MHRKILIITVALLLFSTGICMAVEPPTNVSLTATKTTITVTWTASNTSDAGFYVYWGTTSTNLDQSVQIANISTLTYTITGLDSGTTYYVAVSEYDYTNTEARSGTQSITTTSDTTKPAVPTGFSVTSLSSITQSSVSLKWNANSESNIDHYNIYYGTKSGTYGTPTTSTGTSITITGLSSDTRYYFTITAVSSANIESDKATELIVDTLPDTHAPFVPSVTPKLSGALQITVTINTDVNAGMVDFAGFKLYYGNASGVYDNTVDLGTSTTYVLKNLPSNSTWYFAVTAYDTNGNESAKSTEESVTVEKTTTFLDRSGHFNGGCFIGTASDSRPDPVREKNKIGIAGAYFVPSEKSFKDFYGSELYPVFAFYERELFSKVSVELTGGYMRKNGDKLTVTGEKTQISSKYTLVPVAASINYNIPITHYIWGFIGAGPDYWYCQEKAEGTSTSHWVGGYHGNVGLWLYNEDPDFKHWGVLIEGNYSQIDRFGGNKTDIGGWLFKFGVFYQF